MKQIKQVTILFDDEGQGYDIKVFLPDGREVLIDVVDEEDVQMDDQEILSSLNL